MLHCLLFLLPEIVFSCKRGAERGLREFLDKRTFAVLLQQFVIWQPAQSKKQIDHL